MCFRCEVDRGNKLRLYRCKDFVPLSGSSGNVGVKVNIKKHG